MTTPGDEPRPDGRIPSSMTRALRIATRALRLHLDTLPIDYDMNAPGDQVLAGLAFMSARQRFDCADSLIGAGFGGTALGAISRSLFVDALRWYWIGTDPTRRESLLVDLVQERSGICALLESTDSSCPNLARWLMPIPVASLINPSTPGTVGSATPTEHDLMTEFLAGATSAVSSPLLLRAGALLAQTELRGAVMVLAHAGHGNYLGMQSSLTSDGAIGHDLREDHEALFMQVAAVGVVVTLLGASAATPALWPSDVDQEPFFETALALAADVSIAAAAVHRLVTTSQPSPTKSPASSSAAPPSPHRNATLSERDLLPDLNSVDRVAEAAEDYFRFAGSFPVRLADLASPNLHVVLESGGVHSNLAAVMSTYDQPGAEVISVFAARMLLEEAARTAWRFAIPDEDGFKARAKQYFDEYRSKKTKTVNRLTGSGVPRADAEAFLALPHLVDPTSISSETAKGRVRLPSVDSMLVDFGSGYPEPGWLTVAYSLLSQVTHSTPIGLLHSVRLRGGNYSGNELSPEMLGLALDVACLSSAYSIGHSSLLLSELSEESQAFRTELRRKAARVHDLARMVHGLD